MPVLAPWALAKMIYIDDSRPVVCSAVG